jgi:hypothetical protein
MSFGFVDNKFFIDYRSCNRKIEDVRTEFAKRAHSIGQSNKNLVLSFSGGTDSQVTFLAFRDSNIPIVCAFLHMPGYNDNELDNVNFFANRYDLDITIIEIDPVKEKDYILYHSERLRIPPFHILHSLFLSKLPKDITFIEGFNGPDPYVFRDRHYILESANSVEHARLRALNDLCPDIPVIAFEKEEHLYLSILKEGTLTAFMNSWNYYKIPGLKYHNEEPISIINYWDVFVKPILFGKIWGKDIIYNHKFQGCEKIDFIFNGMKHQYRENSIFVPVESLIEHLETGVGIKRFWQRDPVNCS